MSTYELLKFAHILAAVVWVGGALALQVVAFRADRSGDPARMAGAAGEIEWIGLRIFMPASLSVLLLGIGLVLEGSWSFGQTWILIALVAYGLSFATGAGFLGPETGRIRKLLDERGAGDSEVLRRIRRAFLVSRIELVVLVAVILDMVVKPGA